MTVGTGYIKLTPLGHEAQYRQISILDTQQALRGLGGAGWGRECRVGRCGAALPGSAPHLWTAQGIPHPRGTEGTADATASA